MDISTVLHKVDSRAYGSFTQFVADIDLIVQNALAYNDSNDQQGRLMRSCARNLHDTVKYMIHFIRRKEPHTFRRVCSFDGDPFRVFTETPVSNAPLWLHLEFASRSEQILPCGDVADRGVV